MPFLMKREVQESVPQKPSRCVFMMRLIQTMSNKRNAHYGLQRQVLPSPDTLLVNVGCTLEPHRELLKPSVLRISGAGRQMPVFLKSWVIQCTVEIQNP